MPRFFFIALATSFFFFPLTQIAFALTPPLTTQRIATGLDRPVYATSPAGDDDRLFVIEQHTGRIKILNLNDNQINPAVFLDLDGLSTLDEQGLLGMAFHLDYVNNGYFYVNFTDSLGATWIVRYSVSVNPDIANAGSALTIMTFSQPYNNHNGGWIGFDPNGDYLYIATGDGGNGNDPGNRAQDITNELLGKMLRIDVDGDDFPGDPLRNYAIPSSNPFVGVTGDDEIWAYGLRNPWRPSFDRVTGDLYIADVGQNSREEIDFQSASSSGGENYGWRVMEGLLCNIPGALPCFDPNFTNPIHEYGHTGAPDGGHSITGGYNYRGPNNALQGTYFFADYVSGQIWTFRYDGVIKTEFTNRTAELTPDVGTINDISSFAEDNMGNLYIISLNGNIFKLIAPLNPGDFNGDGLVDEDDLILLGQIWLVPSLTEMTAQDLNFDDEINYLDFVLFAELMSE